MSSVGQPLSRVDGPAKVTGQAKYAAEFALPRLAHAALVLSTIPRGTITRIETASAEAADGVLAVMTHENAPPLAYRSLQPTPVVDPKSGEQLKVLRGPRVRFCGEPVAVVVAETLDKARFAAGLIDVEYEPEQPHTEFGSTTAEAPSEASEAAGRPGETRRGDAETALAKAEVAIDSVCIQPRAYHNAIEPHATIADWRDGELILYDKTQWVNNDRREIAHVFGIPEDRIRIVSTFIGGAFGSALRTWPHVTIAAMAARHVGRPVRVELSRRQLYSSIGFRPFTWQRVQLGSTREGQLTSLMHQAVAETSTYEEYAELVMEPARSTYSCPHVLTRYRLVPMDTNTPCPMRAPGVVTGTLALEMAMDDLALKLGIDPLEVRRRNYADKDEATGLPWSSKELQACYDGGAERFGWDRRSAVPGQMREGNDLIGYGMATAIYHAKQAAASAHASMFANGSVHIATAGSDMGPGTYTSLTQIASDALSIPAERVTVELGDTRLPDAPVHGGSITMASLGNAINAACTELKRELQKAACGDDGPFAGRSVTEVVIEKDYLRLAGEKTSLSFAELIRTLGRESVGAAGQAGPGEEAEKFASYAFGAVFVEVRVDADMGTVRVPRVLGAYDAGRIVNPKLARSQCIGGIVGGLGMALFEEGEWDSRFGRVVNANLAEYLVPVCADAGDFEVIFVPNNDTNFNPLGVKGLAEIAICGVAPAVANGVYNATGKRIRSLPITADKVLSASV